MNKVVFGLVLPIIIQTIIAYLINKNFDLTIMGKKEEGIFFTGFLIGYLPFLFIALSLNAFLINSQSKLSKTLKDGFLIGFVIMPTIASALIYIFQLLLS